MQGTGAAVSSDIGLVDGRDWAELAARLSGRLSFAGEAGYGAAEPWNLAVSVRPLAVVEAQAAGDVVEVVRWAAANDVRVAVQRTGHGAMTVEGDVVLIATAGLDTLSIDGAGRAATIGAGVLWGDVVQAAAEHGLVPVCGSSAGTGAVGFLSGGGIGPMARTFGVGSDRVRSFEVVTGDGQLRRATAEQNAELFWGLRGGRGTLGIITSAVIELVRCPTFYGGNAYFAEADIASVLQAWQSWSAGLPVEATTSVCILQLPPLPGVPEPLAGRMTLSVRLAWVGDESTGRAFAQNLLAVATPVLGGFGRMRGADLAAVHQDPAEPMPFREYGYLLTDFPPEAVEEFLVSAGPGSGSPLVMAEVRQLGGAMQDAPPVPDAYCGRAAGFNLMIGGVPVPDPSAVDDAAAQVLDALRPWSAGGMMPNFVVRADDEAMAAFYDPATLQRLQLLGEHYDPSGVLRFGQVARTR